jgi:hypothetical protein
MFSNTTGAQNVALGVMTLRANIGGGNNTGIGTNALYVNTSGGSNTALGVSALGSNVGGSYNVALGSNSGSFNTNGQYNTYVGHVAGNNLTTGSNNIFLGYAAGTGVANASNKLYIESTTNTTPLIGGDFSSSGRFVTINGKLGIGVSSPAHKLHVVGNIYTTGDVRTAGGTKGCPTGWSCNAFFWDVSTQGIYYTNLNNTSDRRLKKNIKELDESFVQKLLKLNPVQFEWRKDKKTGRESKGIHYGFIAQEVEAIWPQLVSTSSDELKTKSLAGTELISPLVKAFQFLHEERVKNAAMLKVMQEGIEERLDNHDKEITELESKVKILQTENRELKSRLDRIEKSLKIK